MRVDLVAMFAVFAVSWMIQRGSVWCRSTESITFGDVLSADIYTLHATMNRSLEGVEDYRWVSENLGINLVTIRRFVFSC